MSDGRGQSVKRQVRSILPFGGGGKILRFSGRGRSSSHRGTAEKRRHKDEDDLYRSLGRIAANWSLIEIGSGVLLMSLVGSRDETLARAVVAGQRVENVWATIEALLSSHESNTAETLAAFRSWRRSANGFRRRRNEAIHSAWSLTSANGGPAAWDVMSQRAKTGSPLRSISRRCPGAGGTGATYRRLRREAQPDSLIRAGRNGSKELERSDGRRIESS